MSKRPDFISADAFRQLKTPIALGRWALVDGILPSSFISRCERIGRPLPHHTYRGGKLYRLIDLAARATADGVQLEPPRLRLAEISLRSVRGELKALEAEVAKLERGRAEMAHELSIGDASMRLTGQTLLREHEIVQAARPVDTTSGVYFLVHGRAVVYVGQSTNVLRRVAEHIQQGKQFDRFAYVACDPKRLNALESLYIHTLRPQLNGQYEIDGRVIVRAPMKFTDLIRARA